MSTAWRRLIVFLVCVIAALQVIHMTLLSRLEAKKSSHHHRRSLPSNTWKNPEKQPSGIISPIAGEENSVTRKRLRDLMYKHIRESSLLDSSGEFRIVDFLAKSDAYLREEQEREIQDVSLVTQCSLSHLRHLPGLTERWKGPISVVVFSMTLDIPLMVDSLVSLRQCYPSVQANTSFHLVYPLNSPRIEPLSEEPKFNDPDDNCRTLLARLEQIQELTKNYGHKIAYPNNLLRNVARRNAGTEFVFVIDVDMTPNVGLYQSFMDFANENKLFLESHKEDKTVYVVPAFEMSEGQELPKDKTNLLQLLDLMEARPFYFELCWKCQKHTDYEAWQRHTSNNNKLAVIFEVLWRDPWEPFFFSRNQAPLHDERFRQYGFNRISQVCELHVAGYKFSVLNNAFIVHKGLKTSSSFHKDKDTDQEKNRILFRQFKTELKDKYPDSSRRCY